jgi:hypothetical protein
MANSVTHAQLQPIYGAAYNIEVGFRDDAGAATAPTTPDTEVSKDAGTFADATNEVTLYKEVGGSTDSAFGYLTLTAAEMTADAVAVQLKSANCVTVMEVIKPQRLVAKATGTAAAGANGSITLASATGVRAGMIVRTDDHTGAGQARVITAFDTGTKVASVAPNWETNPDNTTDYTVGLPVALSVASEQLDVLLSTRGTSTYAGGAVASVTAPVETTVTPLTAEETALAAQSALEDAGVALQASLDLIMSDDFDPDSDSLHEIGGAVRDVPTATQNAAAVGTELATYLDTILGLVGENQYITADSFDLLGRMQTGVKRIYSVAGSVGTEADVIATYDVTATYEGTSAIPVTYEMVKRA